ncbi:hypothetical protein PFBG_04583 [Plasmodium falciparum 7G8]|uniref:Uncharacterized protein n=3 Tax=Plasmodium falciparum TaxID=5833 RepID=A0A024V3T6_PLAFA|nr:hypothetical protein PFFVO_04150 [Plasmodium falciparum Vietnam Oak-Knoll (FVO)]ETW41077.1 hypothetical protein PFNF135_04711 [Plasmodium falciparum NF135/5.C10]EUR66296.1 hypothetical protein PFBG_04583 [Plasmodium falciparum 7G8]
MYFIFSILYNITFKIISFLYLKIKKKNDIYNILFYLKSYNFVLLYFKNNFLPTKIVYNYIIFYYSN